MKRVSWIAWILVLVLALSGTAMAQVEQGVYRPFLADVDGDTAITAGDALKVLQHVVKLITLNETELAVSDVEEDEEITALDALRILQIVVRLHDPLDVMQISDGWVDDFDAPPTPEEVVSYDSLEQLIEAAGEASSPMSSDLLRIPSTTEGMSVSSVWSRGRNYGYTVSKGEESFSFAFDAEKPVAERAIRAFLLEEQKSITAMPRLCWVDWAEKGSALMAARKQGTVAAVAFETMTLTVSTDRPVAFSASLFADAEAAQAATDTVFGWAEWFEFAPAQ